MNSNGTHTGQARLAAAPGQKEPVNSGTRLDVNSPELQAIIEAVQATRFGEITVIVQDGYIIQVNRLEKRRLR